MIIYKTTNLINNKIYIGQDSKNNPDYFGSGRIIVKAINKYGKNNFIKEIIDVASTKEELDEKEIFWIKELNSKDKNIGYNLTDGGGGTLGYKPSEETRLKMRLNNIGENNPMFGVKLSNETIKKRTDKVKSNGTFKGKNNGNFKYDISKHDLYDYYITKNMKIDEIATIYQCHRTVISDNLKNYNIIKEPSNKYSLNINEINNYLTGGYNLVQIGNIYGCSNKIIHKFIKKYKNVK